MSCFPQFVHKELAVHTAVQNIPILSSHLSLEFRLFQPVSTTSLKQERIYFTLTTLADFFTRK